MKRILIGMIRFYRKYLSGLKGYSTCKYYPTCSQYGIEAIEKYGALKGGALAVWRILRCNPFSKGGYDPDLFTVRDRGDRKVRCIKGRGSCCLENPALQSIFKRRI